MANQKTKAAAVPKPRTTRSRPPQSEKASPPRRNRAVLITVVLGAIMVLFAGGLFWNQPSSVSLLSPSVPKDMAENMTEETSPSITKRPGEKPDQPVKHEPMEDVITAPERLTLDDEAVMPEQGVPSHAKQSPTQEQQNAQAITDIKTALDTLKTDFDALNTALANVTARLDGIDRALENRMTEATLSKDWSLLITIGQIRQSLHNGQPYAADLAILTAMLAADPVASHFLENLRPYAERGLPSRGELSRQFTAQAALWADTAETKTAYEETGIWDEALHRLKALVRIRRVGEQPGNSPEALVARAENQLNADDLAAAGTELLSIPKAQLWANQAIGRAKAERALHDLTAWVMDQK